MQRLSVVAHRCAPVLAIAAAALVLTMGATAQAATPVLVNPEFATGDTTGWQSTTTQAPAPFVTTGYQGEYPEAPSYISPRGSHFAVVLAGCQTNTLSQTFTAAAGETLEGWSFFQSNDYLPFNDSGSVTITGEGAPSTVFSSSVSEVGSYTGSTNWVQWAYTFSASGTYTISVALTNNRDCAEPSAVGFVLGGEPTTPPPTASIESPVSGGTYAQGAVVPTSFSCTEGSGGPGIASCTDSNGGSGTSGTLDTSTAGPHTYTVTAASSDGLTGTASITYTVIAPPTASIESPASGDTYAVGQVVPTSFSCTEGAEGPGIESCTDSNGATSPGALDTSTAGPHTYIVTAKSEDGQEGTAEITYTVAAAPTAMISSPASGGTYAQGTVVPTSFSCSEGAGGSGVESCTDSNGGSGTSGTLDTSTVGAHTYTVTATSEDGQEGTAEISYTVTAAPTASISSPAGGGTYAVGQVVATSFSCTEGAEGPGIESCTDSNGATSPGALDTSTAGPHRYIVTAKSEDGQEGTATINYTVAAAPTASIESPASGVTYAVGQVVATSFSCTEGAEGPGIESCTDSNGASEPNGTLETATVGPHTYIVTAKSEDGQEGTAEITYTVAAAPTATITSPESGATYAVGQVVATSFSCTDGAEGPGIESCTDSNGASEPNGTLETATVGPHTYIVTAKSEDGQEGTAEITYTVAAAPEASISSPVSGGAYAQGAVVPTSFSCTEGAEGPGVESCTDSHGGSGTSGTLDTSTAGPHTYIVTAKSEDGQEGTAEITYTVAAAPTAMISSPVSGGVYAVGQSVPTSFSCTEGAHGPGIASCTDSHGGSGTSGTLDTSTVGAHTYTVTATSKDGQEDTAEITYTVAAAPTASISSPASGGSYAQGAVVPTSFSCAEGSSGSGISSCTDSHGGSGTSGTLDTSTVGAHTYTVTATSSDGQTGTASITYTVVVPVVPVAPAAVVAPVVAAAKALTTTVAPSDLLITPKACVSRRKLTIHVVRRLNGMKITSAKVLLAGRVVARLSAPHLIAHLSFAGLEKGAFKITIVARTSTGSTVMASIIIHTCVSGKG